MKIAKPWKRLTEIIVSNLIVGTLIGAAIYFSKPEYREFVPISEHHGYYLSIDNGRTSVQSKGGFCFDYIVDENKDLKPDYTLTGIVANVRLAGQFKRIPTQEEIDIFNKVLKNSKKFRELI